MAGKLNLTINQGETFKHVLKWSDEANVPYDLTGYTVKMQIKDRIESLTPLIELTSANGGVIIDAPLTGAFTLFIAATTTSGFTWTTGVYDLLMTSPLGIVTRLIEGRVTVVKGVTQ